MGKIELKTKRHASLCSNLENIPEEALIAKQVEQVLEGPKSLQSILGFKRQADDTFDIPQFCQGYMWSDIPHSSSPSAAYTESAPLLPSPPPHLLSDPIISTALTHYQKFIKVETPFNIE